MTTVPMFSIVPMFFTLETSTFVINFFVMQTENQANVREWGKMGYDKETKSHRKSEY